MTVNPGKQVLKFDAITFQIEFSEAQKTEFFLRSSFKIPCVKTPGRFYSIFITQIKRKSCSWAADSADEDERIFSKMHLNVNEMYQEILNKRMDEKTYVNLLEIPVVDMYSFDQWLWDFETSLPSQTMNLE